EGLQHQDGSSHLVAATIPNCKAYDPAFACELAVIIGQGVREMMVEQQDGFYYVTLMNENYAQPDLRPGSEAGILRGCYYFDSYSRPPDEGQAPKTLQKVTLMGSGAILTEGIKAAQQLAAQGVDAAVYSVTSWSELARDGAARQQRALAGEAATQAFIAQQLAASKGPIIAATDYVRAVPESIRAFLPPGRSYLTLGTDGFGRSDTRAALRGFFGVDAASIVRAALHQLSQAQ
ncbi:MAG: pyruvate dehydrogenase (acetyl-transferring), homodimeric type, partial [Pseudomonadota bacterium]|nr:pyruvate dehydrogenase (acetyl-transferring), homodimeric type [Pseudomonadota bacterium]